MMRNAEGFEYGDVLKGPVNPQEKSPGRGTTREQRVVSYLHRLERNRSWRFSLMHETAAPLTNNVYLMILPQAFLIIVPLAFSPGTFRCVRWAKANQVPSP